MGGFGKGLIIGIVSLVCFLLIVVACNNTTSTPAQADAPPSPPGQTFSYDKSKITRENPEVIETVMMYRIWVKEPDGTISVYKSKGWKFYGDNEYFKFMLMDDAGGDINHAREPLRFPVRC